MPRRSIVKLAARPLRPDWGGAWRALVERRKRLRIRRHGSHRLARSERDRRHAEGRHRHRAAPEAHAGITACARRAIQGPRRPAVDRVRVRDVAYRVRRAEREHGLPRQADEEPHADADDRAREPGVPRQAERRHRRLRERVRLARAGPGPVWHRRDDALARAGQGRPRRRAPRCARRADRGLHGRRRRARGDGGCTERARSAHVRRGRGGRAARAGGAAEGVPRGGEARRAPVRRDQAAQARVRVRCSHGDGERARREDP